MKNPLFTLLFTAGVLLLIDIYVYQALKVVIATLQPAGKRWITSIYWLLTLIALGTLSVAAFTNVMRWPDVLRAYLLTSIMIIYFSKLVVVLFLVIEDVYRAGRWLFNQFTQGMVPDAAIPGISRSKFLSLTGIFFGALPFVTLVYGMARNAYRYKIRRVTVSHPLLPDAFEGLKIVQISDIHAGSFTTKNPLKKAVELINKEKPDLFCFTGDLVNNRAGEMKPYVDIFSKIETKMGNYSILGNHDYGDYYLWSSPEAKYENLQKLKQTHTKLGWRLLLNEHQVIEKDGQKIVLAGVENWSAKLHFPKYGNLEKAMAGTESIPFKILLSHDPSHWDAEILEKNQDIALTLSGHTHGFQFGVEIPGFKWSPVQYVYKQWAGLYQMANQYLYVNRGFGFIGYPGRIGILPEITVLTLKKANKATLTA